MSGKRHAMRVMVVCCSLAGFSLIWESTFLLQKVVGYGRVAPMRSLQGETEKLKDVVESSADSTPALQLEGPKNRQGVPTNRKNKKSVGTSAATTTKPEITQLKRRRDLPTNKTIASFQRIRIHKLDGDSVVMKSQFSTLAQEGGDVKSKEQGQQDKLKPVVQRSATSPQGTYLDSTKKLKGRPFSKNKEKMKTASATVKSSVPRLDKTNEILKGHSSRVQRWQQPKEETIASKVKLQDFRICRVTPQPEVGRKLVHVNGTIMPVEFQCNGEPYQQFATLLEQLIPREAQSRALTSPEWGRRTTMVPYHNKGLAILIMGNSHTRQLVSTLLCQHRDRITAPPKLLYSTPTLKSRGVWEIHLQGNVTIYSANNCPIMYSPNWIQILESQILQRPLASLDAIVMGRFNQFTESTSTKFYDDVMAYQRAFPNLGMDFEHSQVPTLADLSKVFQGPILYVSMFAKYGVQYYLQAQESAAQRSNLAVVDGRRYISQLERSIGRDALPVQECSSDESMSVSTCVTDRSSYRFHHGHRCMGARGGHPDLIAWDVVEFFHQMLGLGPSGDSDETSIAALIHTRREKRKQQKGSLIRQ